MMQKLVYVAVFVALVGFAFSPAFAAKDSATELNDPNSMVGQSAPSSVTQRGHLFEKRAGTWKATCDEMEGNQVYCKMFHIEQFGEWKTKNFIQVGPAWTPDDVGFVVATYLGFKEGTTVTIGIDKHERHKHTAPKGNNFMISPEIAANIIQEMENGHKLVVTFHSHSGVHHLTLADLGPARELLAAVKVQMAKNAKQ